MNKLLVAFFLLAVLLNVSFARRSGRIVNGKEAVAGQFPYQVVLYSPSDDLHFCGGSIIGPRHILTAAHCFESDDPSDVQVRMGTINYDTDEGVLIQAQKVIIHPDYDTETSLNDVAIIKLKVHVPRSDNIATIKLAKSKPSEGKTVTLSGFGDTTYGGEASPQLLYTRNEVVSTATCQQFYSDYSDKQQLCLFRNGTDTCQGDSGGPAATGKKLEATVVGVVSYGQGCGTKPGVYASVSYFRDWIHSQVSWAATVRNPEAGKKDEYFKNLCEAVDGTYKADRMLKCKGLTLTKISDFSFTWEGCKESIPAKKLCKRLGVFSCSDDVATCSTK